MGRYGPKPRPVAERFWQKVQKTETCWLWVGFINPDGYGHFWCEGTNRRAHRVAYVLEVGPIPAGLTVDHVCRNRACVRPDHLRLCTISENVRDGVTTTAALNLAKTHCPQGHPYSGKNLYLKPDGARSCRTCRRDADRRNHARRMDTQRRRRALRKQGAVS